ncbi:MAG: right-handed parallel beta-helix repeat-containing protein, partial [Calditrichota bacterium]
MIVTGGLTTINGLALNNTSGFGLTLSNIGENTIKANQIAGISIASSGNTINSNTISNSVGDGIAISGRAENNLIGVSVGNNISGNAGYGISQLNSNNNQIINNTINSNSLGGISITSSVGTLNNNIISGNFGPGISLNTTNGFDISDNVVETNSSGGFYISNSTGNLSGNSITGNMSFGISLNLSDNNTLIENEISGNSGPGLLIYGNNNQINNNTIFNNGTSGSGAGVFVESGNNNSILNNSVFDNSFLGTQLGLSANDSQAYPTLNTLYTWQDETALPDIKGGTSILGTLTSDPGENFKIQFFANAQSSANREGKRYLGEIEVSTDISGEASFVANFKDVVLPEADGEVVSASATRLDNLGNPLSTSEFSSAISRETDEGLHYQVNTTLAGIPLHWENGEGNYQIASSVVAHGYDNEVQNGFDTWSGLEQLTYTRKPNSTEQWGGNPDGVNNVVWISDSTQWVNEIEAPTNVIAVTRVRYNALNGQFVD